MIIVTFVIDDITTCSGIAHVVRNIANALVEDSRYSVKIISLGKAQHECFYNINQSISVHYAMDCPNGKKNRWKAAEKVCRILDKNSNYVVLCEMGLVLPIYIHLWYRKGMKLLSWEHVNFMNGKPYGYGGLGKRLSVLKFYKVIVVTKADRKNFDAYRFPNNVVQIYNPLDTVEVHDSYDIHTKKIISCGSLSQYKGFDMAINVAQIVFSRHPDWTWDIYGSGSEYDSLLAGIREAGLENNMFLKGFCKDMHTVYNDYSFFVLTSRKEGFGLVITEAQQHKLPVVSFACPCGPIDLVSHGQNGFLVECFDIEAMADKICFLIEHPEKRKEFSQNSGMLFEELSIDAVINKWKQLLV